MSNSNHQNEKETEARIHEILIAFAKDFQEFIRNKPRAGKDAFDTLPRLKSWDSTSTRPLADPVLRLSVTAWCPIRESIFTQGSPFELIPYGIY